MLPGCSRAATRSRGLETALLVHATDAEVAASRHGYMCTRRAELEKFVAATCGSITGAVDQDKGSLTALQHAMGALAPTAEKLTRRAQAGLAVDEETATVVVQVRPPPLAGGPQPPRWGPTPILMRRRRRRWCRS